MRVINSTANEFIVVKVSQRTTSETDCRFAAILTPRIEFQPNCSGKAIRPLTRLLSSPTKLPIVIIYCPNWTRLPRVILTLWRLRSLDKRRDQFGEALRDDRASKNANCSLIQFGALFHVAPVRRSATCVRLRARDRMGRQGAAGAAFGTAGSRVTLCPPCRLPLNSAAQKLRYGLANRLSSGLFVEDKTR